MMGLRSTLAIQWLAVLGGLIALASLGCSMMPRADGMGGAPALRIGIAPTYAPLAFRNDDGLTGIEVELARRMSSELKRQVRFVELDRDALIPALEEGLIDVIMSGMSITEARSRRVLFSNPYMRIGQLALIRSADLARLGVPAALGAPGARVGFARGTTGQDFVTQQLQRSESYAFDTVEDGIRSLRSRRIDFFIHDAPTIWRVALDPNERDLMGLYRPLTKEYLAWAVARDNTKLKAQLDELLDEWRAKGEIDRIVDRWIPVRVSLSR